MIIHWLIWRKKRKEANEKNSVRFFDWTTQILRTAEQLNDGKRKIIINFSLLYSGSLSIALPLSFLLSFNRCHRHRSRPYFLRVCALFLSFHFISLRVPCRVCASIYLSLYSSSHICACTCCIHTYRLYNGDATLLCCVSQNDCSSHVCSTDDDDLVFRFDDCVWHCVFSLLYTYSQCVWRV